MLLRTDTIPDLLCLQVHMVFRVQVCVNGQRLHNEDLLFVRLYVSEDDTHDPSQDLGLRHLVWGHYVHFSILASRRQKPLFAE